MRWYQYRIWTHVYVDGRSQWLPWTKWRQDFARGYWKVTAKRAYPGRAIAVEYRDVNL